MMRFPTCLLVFVFVVVLVQTQNTYPVPIPAGGRVAVHGWMILPFQDQYAVDAWTDKPNPLRGWLYHHVPEFPATSPHDFNIFIKAEMTSLPHAGREVAPLAFPIPPRVPPPGVLWTFTPPPSFSLNDLLSGSLTRINGVVYNGSFDTSYERIPTNIATVEILELTTAYYLNSSDGVPVYEHLNFNSYPFIENKEGLVVDSSVLDFYFGHALWAPTTDYDQIMWMTLDTQGCECACVGGGSDCGCPAVGGSANEWFQAISEGGQRWVFPYYPNYPGLTVSDSHLTAYAVNSQNQNITCNSLVAKQDLHCTYGPLFGELCHFNPGS